MKNIVTHQDLENQIAELKKQIEFLQLPSSMQNGVDTESYTQSVLNNMGDAVFIKDDQSRLVFVNDACAKFFKLPRTEIIGKTLAEHVLPEERESFLKIDRQVLQDGIENINEEFFTFMDAPTQVISTRKSRFIDSKGKKFLVGVVRDITKSKAAEKALKISEVQLREINATKDKLFSIIAHDLRSPFNNILALSELLLKTEKEFKEASSTKSLELINSTAKNTMALLDNLLDWARSQTGQIHYRSEKINLSNVVRDIFKESNPAASTKNIALSFTESVEIEVFSDINMLKVILRNLLSNAIKFTNPGGKIGVFIVFEQNHAQISISDNGVGMDETTRKKLFNLSATIIASGTQNEKGSGLGLVLCKEFVEKLGGSIWVESEEGKGSTFNFTLPIAL